MVQVTSNSEKCFEQGRDWRREDGNLNLSLIVIILVWKLAFLKVAQLLVINRIGIFQSVELSTNRQLFEWTLLTHRQSMFQTFFTEKSDFTLFTTQKLLSTVLLIENLTITVYLKNKEQESYARIWHNLRHSYHQQRL